MVQKRVLRCIIATDFLQVISVIYCPATVDCHDTKAKNAGNQLLFGNQLLLLGNQLYTQENSDFSRVHYFKILIIWLYNLQNDVNNTPDTIFFIFKLFRAFLGPLKKVGLTGQFFFRQKSVLEDNSMFKIVLLDRFRYKYFSMNSGK